MPEGLTILSLFAIILYSLVGVFCIVALRSAFKFNQEIWHIIAWGLISGLFILLIASRIFLIEDVLRAELRGWLGDQDLVSERRDYQGPIVAVVIIIATVCIGVIARYFAIRLLKRRDRAVGIAVAASAAMIILIILRSISLHSLDAFLYGPLKLNWIGDIGASLTIFAASAYYTGLLTGRIRPKTIKPERGQVLRGRKQ